MRKNGNLAISQHDAIASPNERLNSVLTFLPPLKSYIALLSLSLFAKIRAW